ncbi:head completion/stabilization protein [Serratia marcescens]|uniref:Head completion/stabilization protein n=1 Tax=Serratia marcescens TaxID=615 RepID=A0A5C7CE05_SERMA|nr:head completion/stabilization protein [Serratia marcescens]TXE33244.1 head completion/stabilization protein [Serratia marcescens]TXE65232.1 head completion/stabilization protein [Serratia marcescens]
MNDFIAAEPPKDADLISNGDFWPAICPAAFTSAMRLDGTTTPERQREALIAAMVNTNRELKVWRLLQQERGYLSLKEVPYDDLVDGESPGVHNYRRAVFCIAKANITERYRDFDATAKGDRRADSLESAVDDLWRDARWAMRELQGLNHNTVALI